MAARSPWIDRDALRPAGRRDHHALKSTSSPAPTRHDGTKPAGHVQLRAESGEVVRVCPDRAVSWSSLTGEWI
jgi:hypothetical protein